VLEIFLWSIWTVENIFDGLSYGGVDYCIMIREFLGFTILIAVGNFKHNELILHEKLLFVLGERKVITAVSCVLEKLVKNIHSLLKDLFFSFFPFKALCENTFY
jgi:hypothetical protein